MCSALDGKVHYVQRRVLKRGSKVPRVEDSLTQRGNLFHIVGARQLN